MKLFHCLFSGLFFLFSCNAVSQKITLTPSMILNETTIGDAGQLVDEQLLAGDPATAGAGGVVTQGWQTGYNALYFPAHAVIDLGVNYNISQIYLYDANGFGAITISSGTPFNWVDRFTDSLKNYLTWNAHIQNFQTRYIRVTVSSATVPLEIVVYGVPLGTIPSPPSPIAQVQPTMDKFIGINAFIDDPLDKMKVAGVIREYHNWNWDEGNEVFGAAPTYPGYPNNLNKWAPGYPGWNFDTYYEQLKMNNIFTFPCVKESVSWITSSNQYKPVKANLNPEAPASYIEHADHMYQYAARYGAAAVADAKLKLASGQPRSSGLNYLNYYEDWNEQDSWWTTRAGYFNPYEYAAMASADYDGHKGAMGTTVGIKNADPNAKLVMGGIAKLDLNYIKSIKFWSDFNRAGSFPADVINLHHYCNDGGEQGSGTVGVSPETDSLKEKLQVFVDYRNRYLQGKEVWISEFGYDTHPSSIQRAPAIGANSQQEVQAQWIIRSYLAIAAAGIDKACMYMLRDVDVNSSTQFSTSGLTTIKGSWTPKISWYYVYALRKRLTGMRYESEPASSNINVKIYKFINSSDNTGAYAVWCPTSNDTKISNYQLTLPVGIASVTQVILTDGDTMGVATPLVMSGGKVSINVSERPVLILTEPVTVSGLPGKQVEENVKIYPNSSDGRFVIEVNQELKFIKICDLYGREIQSFNNMDSAPGKINVDISKFPGGVYVVKFEGLNGMFSREIIKK